HARQRVDCLWVKRMLDRRYTLCFERFDRLGDFVPEFDAADALIAALNSCGFALNFDLEPYPADASRLHREAAGLAGNAGIGLVAADDGVERAMTTDFLVDHYINEDVALEFNSGGLEKFDCENVAGNATLHVTGTAAIDAALLHLRRPGIIAPALAVAHWDDISVPVQQKRTAATRALPRRDNIGPALIALFDGDVAGVFLQLFPARLPHIDVETDLLQVAVEEGLDLAFVAGDARDRNNVLKKLDRFILVGVDSIQDRLSGLVHLNSLPAQSL